ncbi:MAG: hypothetical protein CBC36_08505 [Verrucomicrobiaceae bacterium TMED76]|nr:MAG: hypothetical protein CBC36_08505 [Verrucomicrobiaceae bacterium TMED76]|tara:strand:+ start:4908 stop:5324 length:417 start_codon:yes stop_codon:yes gene_type:complete
MAEGLFSKLVNESGLSFEISSAGISTFGGQPPSKHTLDILRKEEIDLSANTSQPVSHELIGRSSYIFAMSSGHLSAIESMFPKALEKTFLVTEFCDSESVKGTDVPDPYGGTIEEYEHTKDLLDVSLPNILEFLKTQN